MNQINAQQKKTLWVGEEQKKWEEEKFKFCLCMPELRKLILSPGQLSSQFQAGGHVDHLRGHQDRVLIFFVIFNLILTCHLSGQEAFFVGSLTRDLSLIWNTAGTEGSVEPNRVLGSFAFLWPDGN